MGTDVSTWATRHRGITGFVVGVVATLVVAGGGVAIAAIPSTTTSSFTGCVSKDTGVLRVIDYQAGKRCRKSERRISWAKGWTHRGDWNGTTTYRPGDVVVQGGSSWVAKRRSLDKAPAANPTLWGLLSRPGATGATGPAGLVTLRYVRPINSEPILSGTSEVVAIACPETLHIVNGGFDVEGAAPENVSVLESTPVDGSDQDNIPDDSWSTAIQNNSGQTIHVIPWGTCSSATDVAVTTP